MEEECAYDDVVAEDDDVVDDDDGDVYNHEGLEAMIEVVAGDDDTCLFFPRCRVVVDVATNS